YKAHVTPSIFGRNQNRGKSLRNGGIWLQNRFGNLLPTHDRADLSHVRAFERFSLFDAVTGVATLLEKNALSGYRISFDLRHRQHYIFNGTFTNLPFFILDFL